MEQVYPRWLIVLATIVALVVLGGLCRECWLYEGDCESSWREQTKEAVKGANPFIEHCRERPFPF
jgi:hypothetical protein